MFYQIINSLILFILYLCLVLVFLLVYASF